MTRKRKSAKRAGHKSPRSPRAHEMTREKGGGENGADPPWLVFSAPMGERGPTWDVRATPWKPTSTCCPRVRGGVFVGLWSPWSIRQ